MNLHTILKGLDLGSIIKEVTEQTKGKNPVFISNVYDTLENIPEDSVGVVLVRVKEDEKTKTNKPLDKTVSLGDKGEMVIFKAYNNHYLEQDLNAKVFKSDVIPGFGLAIIASGQFILNKESDKTETSNEEPLNAEIETIKESTATKRGRPKAFIPEMKIEDIQEEVIENNEHVINPDPFAENSGN